MRTHRIECPGPDRRWMITEENRPAYEWHCQHQLQLGLQEYLWTDERADRLARYAAFLAATRYLKGEM